MQPMENTVQRSYFEFNIYKHIRIFPNAKSYRIQLFFVKILFTILNPQQKRKKLCFKNMKSSNNSSLTYIFYSLFIFNFRDCECIFNYFGRFLFYLLEIICWKKKVIVRKIQIIKTTTEKCCL